MKKEKSLLLSLLFVCLASCKAPYAPPLVERCVHNQDNSAECADLRKPQGEQSYERIDLTNYICTGPSDEEKMYNYCADLRQKLINCENQPRNLKK